MRERRIAALQRLTVEADALLIDQTARLALALRQPRGKDYVQDRLTHFQIIFRHLIGYFLLLEHFDESLLRCIGSGVAVENAGNLTR